MASHFAWQPPLAGVMTGCPIAMVAKVSRCHRGLGLDWGSRIAIPPLIFTFVAARQIISGLTAGAVKG